MPSHVSLPDRHGRDTSTMKSLFSGNQHDIGVETSQHHARVLQNYLRKPIFLVAAFLVIACVFENFSAAKSFPQTKFPENFAHLQIAEDEEHKNKSTDKQAPTTRHSTYAETKDAAQDRTWIVAEERLLNNRIPYYVYDDPNITQQHIMDTYENRTCYKAVHDRRICNRWKSSYLFPEIDLIKALQKHPWRVYNPDEAEFFYIPLSLTACHLSKKFQGFSKTFDQLTQSPIFQRTQGHRHVLTLINKYFYDIGSIPRIKGSGLAEQYGRTWNMTVVRDSSAFDVRKGRLLKKFPTNEWIGTQKVVWPASRSGLSLGLLPDDSFPYVEASLEKFQRSKFCIFYHTEERFFYNNSTQYRLLLTSNTIKEELARLPESSIGLALEPKVWWEHFSSSKFCLVVRGDEVTSKALLRSLKAGCIPVVICNVYKYYGPSMEDILPMEEWVYFVSEADYMKDPVGELLKISHLPESEIRKKLDAIAFAQRVLLPTANPNAGKNGTKQHLFVPAFWNAVKIAKANQLNYTQYPFGSRGKLKAGFAFESG